MKNRLIVCFFSLLLFNNIVFSQTRKNIQNYTDVAALQAETLVPRVNDKIYVSALKGVFTWESTNVSVEDGTTIIKQTSIATGRWVAIGGSNSSNWGVLGNAATTEATNFVGTSDNIGLSFRTNNIIRQSIANNGNIGILNTIPTKPLTIGTTFGSYANRLHVSGGGSGLGSAAFKGYVEIYKNAGEAESQLYFTDDSLYTDYALLGYNSASKAITLTKSDGSGGAAASVSVASPTLETAYVGINLGFATPEIARFTSEGLGIGVNPTKALDIVSGVADSSGVRLRNLTSASPTSTGQAIGVDANGNVITVPSPGNVATTYGRVNVNTTLASSPYTNLSGGTDILFNNTIYSNGVNISGNVMTPTVSGRYRASWLMIAGSEEFAADGWFHVNQGVSSLGQVRYNMMEAAGVNQASGFIDVDLVAGQSVTLSYRTAHTASDNIGWNSGSYFQIEQISGLLPVTGQLNENVLTGLTAGQTVPAAGNPLALIAKIGNALSIASNQVVLTGGKSYKMLATISRMNGTGGVSEIAYQFRNVTDGVYIGNEGTVTQNTGLGAGATAMADIFVPTGTTKTIQLWVTKNISAGTLSLNGIGNGGAGSFYVYQDGAGAISQFQGATALLNGSAGFVTAPTAGQQNDVLKGDGTWGTGSSRLSDITAATEVSTINNSNFTQNWFWNLTGALNGFNLSEGVASVGGTGTLLRVGTLATSSIKPFTVLARGNAVIDVANTGVTAIGNATGATSNTISAGATGTTVFNQNGLEVMRVHNNGLVGIGTAAPTSDLHLVGSIAMATTSTSSAAYTILSTDNTVFLNLAGTQTITLPAASSFNGRIMTFINTAANFKTISTYTTKFGVTNTTIYNRKTLIIQSDGTVWREIGGNNDEATLSSTVASVVIAGVTFSITWADPLVLTTSGNATGYIKADVVQYSINQVHDYWLNGTSGTLGMIVRGGSASGTARNIGIWSAGYSCNGSGILSVGGFDYQITVATAGTTYGKVSIKILN